MHSILKSAADISAAISAGRHKTTDWRIGVYEETAPPPKDALRSAQTTLGTSAEFQMYYSTMRRHSLKADIPVLCAQLHRTKRSLAVGALRPYWWYPEVYAPTQNRGWSDTNHIWFSRRYVPPGTVVPFNCNEPRFKKALESALDFGGVDAANELDCPVAAPFLQRLIKHYAAA